MTLGKYIPKLDVLQATPIVDPDTGMATIALITQLQSIMDRVGGSSSSPLTGYLSAPTAAATYYPLTGGAISGPVSATVFNGSGSGLTGTASNLTAGFAVTITGGIQGASITWDALQAFAVAPIFGLGIRVSEGVNMKQGVATLVAGTVTIANTSITATSRILLTRQGINASTAIGELAVASRIAGTSFTITSYIAGAVTTQTGDLSTVAYFITEAN